MLKRPLFSTPLLAAGLSLLLAACTGNATPPVAPVAPPPLPLVVPPPPPPPELPLPPPVPEAPVPAPAPPHLAEPLPALARTFTLVPMPGVKDAITGISGRNSSDIWLLSGETLDFGSRPETGVVYRYDGKRVKSYGHPCIAANWGDVVAGKDIVVATGYRAWSRGVLPLFRATLSPDGKWSCDHRDVGFTMGITRSAGGRVWQLSCISNRPCRLDVAGASPVPFPSYHPSGDEPLGEEDPSPLGAFAMTSASDGWLVNEGEDGRDWLFRFNGVTWTPLAPLAPETHATDVWGDAEGNAWIPLRTSEKDDDPATALLRWDGHTLAHVAVPASFKVGIVRGSGPRDVWFFGPERAIYHFDGQHLRQGKGTFDIIDAWAAPDGDLWIVGAEDVKRDAPAARAAHTGPLPEVQK